MAMACNYILQIISPTDDCSQMPLLLLQPYFWLNTSLQREKEFPSHITRLMRLAQLERHRSCRPDSSPRCSHHNSQPTLCEVLVCCTRKFFDVVSTEVWRCECSLVLVEAHTPVLYSGLAGIILFIFLVISNSEFCQRAIGSHLTFQALTIDLALFKLITRIQQCHLRKLVTSWSHRERQQFWNTFSTHACPSVVKHLGSLIHYSHTAV